MKIQKKSLKDIKFWDLWGFYLIILMVVGYFIVGNYIDKMHVKIEENGIETNGVVIKRKFKKRADVYVYNYWVNYKKYSDVKGSYENIPVGKCFLVKYLPSNPKESIIYFDKPIPCPWD